MRKMVISFGWNAKFVGGAETIMKIANLIDENLTRVDDSWDDDGLYYYDTEKQDVQLFVLSKDQEIKTLDEHKAIIDERDAA